MKEERPWGSFEILSEGDDYKLKRLIINPGEKTSLQYHHERDEIWRVVSGNPVVEVNYKEIYLRADDSISIQRLVPHRIKAVSNQVIIIELQTGNYFGEDDIVRIEDNYGRV